MKSFEYKAKALKAINELIEMYDSLYNGVSKDNTVVASPISCPLCKIFRNDMREYISKDYSCWGCPSASESGDAGCMKSPTMQKLDEYITEKEDNGESLYDNAYRNDYIGDRYTFWKEKLEILKKLPDEWFDPKEKHFFDLDNMV